MNTAKAGTEDLVVKALAVGANEEDYACLRRIFERSNWLLLRAGNVLEAAGLVNDHRIGVVVAQLDFADGTWQDLIDRMGSLSPSPRVIVIAGGSDDEFWTAALNHGAYDVLSKPFNGSEVAHVIGMAWLHWKGQIEQAVLAREAAHTAEAARLVAMRRKRSRQDFY